MHLVLVSGLLISGKQQQLDMEIEKYYIHVCMTVSQIFQGCKKENIYEKSEKKLLLGLYFERNKIIIGHNLWLV
jgi:Mor family transcriptional regulator